MISDKLLQHCISPVSHIRVISECKYAGCRKYKWEEGFRPGIGGVSGSPRCIAIVVQAVDEDDAGREM